MRWQTKIEHPSQKKEILKTGYKGPKIGDLKEIEKFAFFPVELNKTDNVWFEKYIEVYNYITYYERSFNQNLRYECGTPYRDRFTAFNSELVERQGWKLKEKKYKNHE